MLLFPEERGDTPHTPMRKATHTHAETLGRGDTNPTYAHGSQNSNTRRKRNNTGYARTSLSERQAQKNQTGGRYRGYLII